MISGFTFIHNGVHGGYPFVEAIQAVQPFVEEMVVVDMQSTDETREVLNNLQVRVVEGEWVPGAAGECLRAAHSLHTKCDRELIWHFEADEVFGSVLAFTIQNAVFHNDAKNIVVKRLQLEQNFQRCRWYPEVVHRVFPNNAGITKQGHTTVQHANEEFVPDMTPDGWLWDITNCFRDDWVHRIRQQAELWGTPTPYPAVMVPLHVNHSNRLRSDQLDDFLGQDHWTWKYSPFNLPGELKDLVGETSYREVLKWRKLL